MKKINNLIKIIFFVVFISVFVGGLVYNQSQIKNAKFMPLFIVFIIFLLFWILLYRKYDEKINNITKKGEIIAFILISVIIITIEMIFGYYLKNCGDGWDLYVIIRTAYNIVNNIDMHIDDVIYFQGFFQNRFIVVLMVLFYKMFLLINVKDILIVGIITNIFMIYTSLVILYFIIRKLYDKKIALFMFASTIFLTPLFLYVPVFYTDTFSMPFIMLIFLFYLYYKETSNIKRKILLATFITINMFLGLQLKMTVVFIGIAIIIDIILNKKLKTNIMYIVYSGLLLFILIGTYNIWLNKSGMFPFDTNDETNKIPYIHWVMMGINTQENYYDKGNTWYGAWRLEDFLYTLNGTEENYDNTTLMPAMRESTLSYQQKKENAQNRLQQKIQALGIKNFIKYLYLKSIFIFADGTYYAPAKISSNLIQPDCKFTSFFRFYGENFDKYFYTAEGIHIAILFLISISAIIDIKEKDDRLNICRIMILELFVFLLAWESRSRYVLNYILIIYTLSIPALQKFRKKNKT